VSLDRLHEERRPSRSTRLAGGTLACPVCDAPGAPAERLLSPVDPLGCGFCGYDGLLRDFLSLTQPTRPTRVTVRVAAPRPRRRVRG
jgi:hypothetical protein